MYCMTLILVGNVSPPMKIPRVDDAHPPNSEVDVVKFPKSIALPRVAMVK